MPDKAPTELAVELLVAYVANNPLPAAELPGLLRSVHAGIVACDAPAPEPAARQAAVPVVPISEAVHDGFIKCLCCGEPFLSLKRHLGSAHGLTPEAYRATYGLPHAYAIVAPAYRRERSALAKTLGFGRKPAIDAAVQ